MIQTIRSRFFKKCFLLGGALILGGCSGDFEGFSNLSEVGERPTPPSSIEAQEKITSLEKDRTLILKKV